MKRLYILLSFLPSILLSQTHPIYEQGQWGFINESGVLITPPQYDHITSTAVENIYITEKDGLHGTFMLSVGEVESPKYDHVIYMPPKGILSPWFIGYKDGKLGAIDSWGIEVASPIYDEVVLLDADIFKVRQDSLWGAISRDGNIFIPPSCKQIELVRNRQVVASYFDGTTSVWSLDGAQQINRIKGSLSSLQAQTDYWILDDPTSKVPKKGYLLSSQGEVLTNSSYVFSGGRIAVNDLFVYQVPDSSGAITYNVLDKEGKTLLPKSYITVTILEDHSIWVEDRRGFGLYNAYGLLLFEPSFERIPEPFSQGVTVVTMGIMGMRKGLINQFGDFLAEPKYDSVLVYDQVAFLKRGSTWSQVSFNAVGSPSFQKHFLVRKNYTALSSTPYWVKESLNPTDYGWVSEIRRTCGYRKDWYFTKDNTVREGFKSVHPIPNTYIALCKKHSGGLKLYNQKTRGSLVSTVFSDVNQADFARFGLARVRDEEAQYWIVDTVGNLYVLPNVTYVGEFQYGFARVVLKGDKLNPKSITWEEADWQFRKDVGKWDMVDKKGRRVLNEEYDFISAFAGGTAFYKKGNEYGLIDSSLNMYSFGQRYDSLSRGNDAQTLIEFFVDTSRFVFMNEVGQPLFSVSANELGDFYQGLAKVRLGDKWGFINEQGEWAIEPQFEDVGDFHEGLALAKKGVRWGYINPIGEYVIEPTFEHAFDFYEGLARVKNGYHIGFIYPNGEWLLRPQYYKATNFHKGRAIIRDKELYGIIDRKGNWIAPTEFIELDTIGGYFRVRRDAAYGYLDRDGNEVIPVEYPYLGYLSEGLICFSKTDGLHGYMDINEEVVLKPQYYVRSECQEGWVWSGDSYVNVANNEVRFIRKGTSKIVRDGIGVVEYKGLSNEKDYQVCWMNVLKDTHSSTKKKQQSNTKSRSASLFRTPTEGALAVRSMSKPHKWEFIDNTYHKECLSKQFDDAEAFEGGLAKVQLANRYTYVNKNGFEQLPYRFESVQQTSNGFLIGHIQKLKGLINTKGEMVAPPIYESITYINGLYQVVKDGQMLYLDETGRRIYSNKL